MVGGDNQHRALPAPERPEMIDETPDGRVGAGHGALAVVAVGSARVRGPVDIGEIDDGEIGLGRRHEREEGVHRLGVEAVAGDAIAARRRGELRRPQHVGCPLPVRRRGEQPRELGLGECAERHEARLRRLGHREERLDGDELGRIEPPGSHVGHPAPVGVAGDAVRLRVGPRQQRDVVRVGARRHHRAGIEERRGVLRVARRELEETRHACRRGEARIEPVDHDQVDVRAVQRTGPSDAPEESQRGSKESVRVITASETNEPWSASTPLAAPGSFVAAAVNTRTASWPAHARHVDGRQAKS